MKEAKRIERINWPSFDLAENFEFDVTAASGSLTLHFKWLNERWNLWVTLPDGTVRQAGVYPGVVSWTGFNDYGFLFATSLEEIGYASLQLAEVYLIIWE